MSKVIGMDGGAQRPNKGLNINVKASDLKDIVCDNCGCKFFRHVHAFKRLSALISPSGKEQIVPLTTKNKAILKANNITIPDIEQEPTAGDGSVMEQVASETEIKKITPQDAGLEADSNFFTSLDSVKAILPNDMSGKEIKEKYNVDFPINDNTIYKPTI